MIDTKTLARHYANLTPEERFRLILAAGSRGDEAERDRLVSTGQRITAAAAASRRSVAGWLADGMATSGAWSFGRLFLKSVPMLNDCSLLRAHARAIW
jgi:hypothetical protein